MDHTQAVRQIHRCRFDPTPAQAAQLARLFGCIRFVHNRAITEYARAWTTEGLRLSFDDTSAMLTAWRRTPGLEFLGEVSAAPLRQALRALHAAQVAYWDQGAPRPQTWQKTGPQRAEFTRAALHWHGGQLTLAKVDGPLAPRLSPPLPDGVRPSHVVVSRDAASRWEVAITVEAVVDGPVPAGV
jgi:putative transposase